jgi:hypothetical protein
MHRSIIFAALLSLLFTSCGSGGKPMTREEFCQEVANRECSSIVSVCRIGEVDCLTTSQSACTNWALSEESNVPPRPFDPGKANACLSKVAEVYGMAKSLVAIDATVFHRIDQACDRVFHGAAKAGEPCSIDADCTGALMCDKGHCGNLKQRGPGEGCANIGETCYQGYACYGASGFPVCAPRPGLGAPCNTEIPCLESLRCNNEVCAGRLSIGACLTDGECSSGFCDPFAQECADDVRFAEGSSACRAFEPAPVTP